MAITEPDKHWGQFNHRLCEILGCSAEQMQQQTWAAITHPDDLAGDVANFERLQRGAADDCRMDKRFIRSDGTVIDAAIAVRCQRDAAGKPVRFYVIVDDIGAREQAEAIVARQRDELERTLQRRTAELDRSVTRLKQVNQELETFTYSVSHDLKAPLRGIDDYSRLLLSEHHDRLDDEGREFLGHIRQATRHMGVLIDDLLAYSRLERRDLTTATLPLAALVDSALVGLQPDLTARGVRLEIDMPPGLCALGDAQGLTMSVRNLLDTAMKFSAASQPPQITITGTRTEEGVLLAIQDNGLGFDMKFHDRIFTIFQRLHRAEDYPGTGVGLAVVRKAMERMGGRVWAVSQPGQGATFTLELPEA